MIKRQTTLRIYCHRSKNLAKPNKSYNSLYMKPYQASECIQEAYFACALSKKPGPHRSFSPPQASLLITIAGPSPFRVEPWVFCVAYILSTQIVDCCWRGG